MEEEFIVLPDNSGQLHPLLKLLLKGKKKSRYGFVTITTRRKTMAKITIEIEDQIPDLVNDAIDGVKEILKDYVEENKSDSLPDINDLDYSGSVHELIDGLIPVYDKKIEDIWFLHKKDLIGAYEDSGVGNNPMENNGMSAIYFYLHQEVNNWYSENAQDYFDEIVSVNVEE
jgi:predicted Zn-dependent protease with MMP-like domain